MPTNCTPAIISTALGTLALLLIVILVSSSFSKKHKQNSQTSASPSTLAISRSQRYLNQGLRFATIHGVATRTAGFRPIRIASLQYFTPINFDTRIKFGKRGIPNSAGLIGCVGPAPMQCEAGASWAYAVAGMLSDRIRIQSSVPAIMGMALANQDLSTEWLMREGNQCVQLRSLIKGDREFSCDPFASCQLGTPVLALQFAQQRGVVASNADGSPNSRAIDLYRIKEFYTVSLDISGEMNYYHFPGQRPMKADAQWAYHEGVVNIQKELMTRGPCVVVFNVYSDLLQQFRRGLKNDDVYIQPQESRPLPGMITRHGISYLGDQAACIVGWGEKYYYSEKIEYWVLRMTWGEDWNGDGCFKIQRGVNCCNLELEVLGSWDYSISSTQRSSYAHESDIDKAETLTPAEPAPWAILE